MNYSKLLGGVLALLAGACSNEAPTLMAGTAGSTGTGGSGGTGGVATGTAIAGAFDGWMFLVPCSGGVSGYDCANVGCVGGNVTKTMQFPIGGMPGVVYDMTFHLRGVVEGYLYDGGTRDSGAMPQMQTTAGNDLFHQDGMPLAMGASGYDYNTMQLEVTPAISGQDNKYFLNSIPITPLDPSAYHLTFIIDYTKTIKVTGGGMMTFTSFDSNCRLIMNCATSSTNMCADHWTVPGVAGAMPPPPATFTQPYTSGSGQFGQWLHFDVTDIVPAT